MNYFSNLMTVFHDYHRAMAVPTRVYSKYSIVLPMLINLAKMYISQLHSYAYIIIYSGNHLNVYTVQSGYYK